MSIANASVEKATLAAGQQTVEQPAFDHASDLVQVQEALQQLSGKVAPVWPLKDYVAVNPFAGLADKKFLDARASLGSLSDIELLMPLDYYRQQLEDGAISRKDIDTALDELVADGVRGAEGLDVNQVIGELRKPEAGSETSVGGTSSAASFGRLRSLSQLLDDHQSTRWDSVIGDEVSKHCANHYDQGQAKWISPWQECSLYEAWRRAGRYDRSLEVRGVRGFRKLVGRLPDTPEAALVTLLNYLGVPMSMWADYLHCQALSIPGWSAWTRYQDRMAEMQGRPGRELAGLLAIKLAHEAALSLHFQYRVDWYSQAEAASAQPESKPEDAGQLLRYTMLRASEIAFRRRLVTGLNDRSQPRPQPAETNRKLAQMVFCIDVRSERIRRQLEATSGDIETVGFAGFFGLPIEFVELGESRGTAQVPVLISPKVQVHEEVDSGGAEATEAIAARRGSLRFLRKAWKDFQASAVSSFSFVESMGWLYGLKLAARAVGLGQDRPSRFDGVAPADRRRLAPSLNDLDRQGLGQSEQLDLAESVLKGTGLVANLGRLVVFCGHGSQTENNPLKAGLDCGACGGHTGESNARLAARLLNQQFIREGLAKRGIEVPQDTQFVAALHNTTTDGLEFFDVHQIPQSHRGDLEALMALVQTASEQTRMERLAYLPGRNSADLVRRSADWSEVRPEWGLAGNAAFLAAPREFSESISLEGRVFLHSYDYRKDAGFALLEQIMTAPLVVANWINLQYYASTVEPRYFGSGNKAIHNVVGRFGIQAGNGGDLMTGLPWQSIHDGNRFQHNPLRLLALIAAPRKAIEAVIQKHDHVGDLLRNGWLQLVAIEEGEFHRYTEQQRWEPIAEARS